MAVCPTAETTFEEVLLAVHTVDGFESLIKRQVLDQIQGTIDGFTRAQRIDAIISRADRVFKTKTLRQALGSQLSGRYETRADQLVHDYLIKYFQEVFRESVSGAKFLGESR